MMDKYFALYIDSKTNGRHLLKINKESYKVIFSFPGFKGLCIQSTNTKREGKNPSLYPCIYGKDPFTSKPYVKQIHRVLIPIVPYGHVVDHKNGDTFDNRLDNLEIVTRAENTKRARAQYGKIGRENVADVLTKEKIQERIYSK